MARDNSKILGTAINALVVNSTAESVNDLIKSSLELTIVSVDDSFEYLEEDVRDSISEILTRSTHIDIMKSVKNIEELPNIRNLCSETDSFKKAVRFMKVANPKFFEQRKKDSESYSEAINSLMQLKQKYSVTQKELEKQKVKTLTDKINNYDYDDWIGDSRIDLDYLRKIKGLKGFGDDDV